MVSRLRVRVGRSPLVDETPVPVEVGVRVSELSPQSVPPIASASAPIRARMKLPDRWTNPRHPVRERLAIPIGTPTSSTDRFRSTTTKTEANFQLRRRSTDIWGLPPATPKRKTSERRFSCTMPSERRHMTCLAGSTMTSGSMERGGNFGGYARPGLQPTRDLRESDPVQKPAHRWNLDHPGGRPQQRKYAFDRVRRISVQATRVSRNALGADE